MDKVYVPVRFIYILHKLVLPIRQGSAWVGVHTIVKIKPLIC